MLKFAPSKDRRCYISLEFYSMYTLTLKRKSEVFPKTLTVVDALFFRWTKYLEMEVEEVTNPIWESPEEIAPYHSCLFESCQWTLIKAKDDAVLNRTII